MLDYTLRLMEAEMRVRGMFVCEWVLEKVEVGGALRFWGRGRIWGD